MHPPQSLVLAAITAILFVSVPCPIHGATQRFEAESSATDNSDWCFGYNYAEWQDYTAPGMSQGAGRRANAAGTMTRIIFGGTGMALVYTADPVGAIVNWTIDDGSSSGQLDQYSSSTTHQQVAILAAENSLADTLHTLELQHSGTGTGIYVNVDAVDVYDCNRKRVEQSEQPPFSYSGWVDTGYAAPEDPSGGSVAYSWNPGSYVDFPFNGRAVAVIECHRVDYGRYTWAIDGGIYSGTVDQSIMPSGGFEIRMPRVLHNSLPDGPHTLRITVLDSSNIILDAVDVSHWSWAAWKGAYIFYTDTLYPYGPRVWGLSEWQTLLDAMQSMGLNYIQLEKAPWSGRPAVTPAETANETLWKGIFQEAKNRSMKTSVVYGSTIHGNGTIAWWILCPNNPATANWSTLVSNYTYFAGATGYGALIDEWHTGVDDPGGCPVCSGISWPYYTPTAQCDPANPVCTVADYVDLCQDNRTPIVANNPAGKLVADTWGLAHFGKDPAYATHLDEFLANLPSLATDAALSTHGYDDALTDALQATGRDVRAWPFYLMDHEFTYGLTKIHFDWMKAYLQKIKNQGFATVVTGLDHPVEMLPAYYIFASLLEDIDRPQMAILTDFADNIVEGSTNEASLALAMLNLGSFWNTVSGVANWDLTNLKPIEDTPPYAKRWNSTQLSYLSNALSVANAVDSPREAPDLPMVVSATQFVSDVHTQAQALFNASQIGDKLNAGDKYLDDHYFEVQGLPSTITRATADFYLQAYKTANGYFMLEQIGDYLLQFYPVLLEGNMNPLAMIYLYLQDVHQPATCESLSLSGDFMEYKASSYPRLYVHLEGRTEETESNFCWIGTWTVESSPGVYSGDTAAMTIASGARVRILFAGTGISLIHSRWNQGAIASWEIDGGAGGTGSIDMYSTVRQDQVVTPLASGLPQNLHVLTVTHSGTGTGNTILVDGVDVQGNVRQRLEDYRAAFSFSPNWVNEGGEDYTGGSLHYTLTPAASCNVSFEGTGVAVTVTQRGDYGTLGWSIDGGAGGSGTVSLWSSVRIYRYPVILSASLSPGPHTLTLSHAGGWLVNVDCIDSVREDLSGIPDFQLY